MTVHSNDTHFRAWFCKALKMAIQSLCLIIPEGVDKTVASVSQRKLVLAFYCSGSVKYELEHNRKSQKQPKSLMAAVDCCFN